MTVSALIRQARTSAGLTQAQLAKRLGIGQPEIARLESPRSNPRMATLERVVAATGHSLELGLAPEMGLDESQIAASLQVSPAERLRHFESFYEFAREFGGQAFAARGS
jgi:transcriptional regulator with XRE-family HTH domain